MLTPEIILERLDNFEPGAKPVSNDNALAGAKLEPGHDHWVRGNGTLKPAAVLVPLVTHEDGLTVLLTKRTEHLNNHAGQISFPGGRVDEADRDARHTALRETEEEIGLGSNAIEVIGRLADYVVGTGYLVSPIVGLVEPPFRLKPHPGEVAEVFEVPLDYVLDPDNFERHSREYEGTERFYYAVTWNDYYIWGATAGMLRHLSSIVWRA
ncbi:MAG: CoA pyrophosphatase [Rhodospirillaceae bacterium]|jgi:8-oxo-dGTP pyrophosphatase MutT (NUDIX family)|nr:CoA pyrophosphatase [Rhodospirillaceae bacterium]MBT4119244.1 CoA pyrophosphatase [Rhodospirillaceae bacterium]MBT4670744.1 CoA pyrophosphatase [Rhodospirillaceae bacterium]MBT4748110.1 CoA pyrophosphatase [Rhodospirillaceae bacterium]MBT5177780.1 CoA pyrophosphatase [Rhodospirillaceae bacterium]